MSAESCCNVFSWKTLRSRSLNALTSLWIGQGFPSEHSLSPRLHEWRTSVPSIAATTWLSGVGLDPVRIKNPPLGPFADSIIPSRFRSWRIFAVNGTGESIALAIAGMLRRDPSEVLWAIYNAARMPYSQALENIWPVNWLKLSNPISKVLRFGVHNLIANTCARTFWISPWYSGHSCKIVGQQGDCLRLNLPITHSLCFKTTSASRFALFSRTGLHLGSTSLVWASLWAAA